MSAFPDIKGKITRWDVLVIGHLRWNRYFGESADSPPRGSPSTCSSTLVTGKMPDGSVYRLIVDPTIRRSDGEYYFDLNRRTGLAPEDITHCFTTHHHFDHWNGLKYFPGAAWLTGEGNKALIAQASEQAAREGTEPGDGLAPNIDASRLQEVEGEFLPGVFAVPLPGHTPDIFGVAFRGAGKRVIHASDSVMTAYHFEDGITEFQTDPGLIAKAAASIEMMKNCYDIVIPGHDSMIVL
ncbi:MAG: MBL fold metallo-hydrolase [Oscillospiraceae bacterium]|nr:MBL fold metallo-hydrolase [Oscillospiraceae bacterium]